MILKPYILGTSLKPYGRNLDDYPFDDVYLDKLLGLLRRDRDGTDLTAFAQDHFNLLYAYVQGEHRESIAPSIEQETEALARVQELARQLFEALSHIQHMGEAGHRLVEDAASLPRRAFQIGDVTLADLVQGPPNKPLKPLMRLLFDLQTALQRAKIEKPRELLAPIGDPDISDKERANRWARLLAKDDDPLARYKSRRDVHGVGKNFALVAFMCRLRETWPSYSDETFTRGRYENAIGTYNSVVLDFAETCLRAFGADDKRSLIAKVLLEVCQTVRDGDAEL